MRVPSEALLPQHRDAGMELNELDDHTLELRASGSAQSADIWSLSQI